MKDNLQIVSKDNLQIGLVAGFWATLWKELSTIIVLPLNFKHTYWDYGSVLAFHRSLEKWDYILIGIIVQIFFSIQLAVIYTYSEDSFKTKYYLIKGSIFGGSIWFLLQGILLIFKIQQFAKHESLEVIWEFGTAVIFGMITAWVVNKLKRSDKYGLQEN